VWEHHHREQHSIGEEAFEQKYDLGIFELALEFALSSPTQVKLKF